MKNLLLLRVCVCLFLGAFCHLAKGQSSKSEYAGAAEKARLYDTQKRITLYTARYEESKEILSKFLNSVAVRVYRKEETTEYTDVEFVMAPKHLDRLDSLCQRLGWVESNSLSTIDKTDKITKLNFALEDEKLRQDSLQRHARTPLTPEAMALQEKSLARSEAIIRTTTRELNSLSHRDSLALVTVKIHDEISMPTSSGRVSFVNMPGVEYGFLVLENPKKGISSRAYQSFAIKYMFTRGKSYFTVGVMKDAEADRSDSTRISELFLIGFGQDFYPKHFGRGKRKFFNLYTGYQLSGLILNRNNEQDSRFMPTANLSMGLELLKTKHILVDNKVSYFLPLHDLNRNMRGILYNASFNFVF